MPQSRGLWLMCGLRMVALVLAFLTGTVMSALFGNFLEGKTRKLACLGEPFVTPDNIPLSLLHVILAGPYFLVGEALCLSSHGHGEVRLIKTVAIAFACLWSLASGILWLEFFVAVAQAL